MIEWRGFARRLADRGVRDDCMACGHPVGEISEERFALVPVDESAQPVLDEASGEQILMPVLGVRCHRCGFVRLHSLDQLLDEEPYVDDGRTR